MEGQEQGKQQNTKQGKRMEPLATHLMALSKPATTMASLNSSMMLVKRVKKYLVFQSGTEVIEPMFGSEKQFTAVTAKAYHSRINNVDFSSNKMTELFGPPPSSFVKAVAMGVLRASSTGGTLYALFKNLQSKFRNC